MKFKGIPGQLCRITKIPKTIRCPKTIRFDADGIFETENKYLIKRLSQKFESFIDVEFEEVEDAIQEEEKETEEEEIRLRAKEEGIKSWHVKSIDRLIKELEDLHE